MGAPRAGVPGLGEAEFMATLASACLDTDLKRRGRESCSGWACSHAGTPIISAADALVQRRHATLASTVVSELGLEA